ncbi:unnamed protein product [Wuchereria bancrofti]|uniref:Uncharacterized protein n=1 Tax=Wuchereria bancrofti TaxID=6293 RepID=A0A3P7DWL6_WUCBA|nr:unnamed protein product [Wuchereria bancrofti]
MIHQCLKKYVVVCPSPYGVWITTAHSQMLQLLKDDKYILILDLGKEQYNKFV